MIRLNRLTDYGMLLLAHLASTPLLSFSATELARETRLTLPTVSKLLKLLTHHGILQSTRGKQGGYRLALLPHLVTLNQVLKALDSGVHLTECTEVDSHCELSHTCATKPHLQQLNHVIFEALNRVTLADLAVRRHQP